MKTAEEWYQQEFGYCDKAMERVLAKTFPIMQSYADQSIREAIQQRDEEIKKWVKDNVQDGGYVDTFDFERYLDISTVEPSANPPQIEQQPKDEIEKYLESIIPEQESDNFRINIIPELTRKELEERCIELYERLHEKPDTLRNEVEELLEKNRPIATFQHGLTDYQEGIIYFQNNLRHFLQSKTKQK